MDYAKKIISKPFLMERRDTISLGGYYYHFCQRAFDTHPNELEEVIEKAIESNILQKDDKDRLSIKHTQNKIDLNEISDLEFDKEKALESMKEKPFEEPETKLERTINNLSRENGLTKRESVSLVNEYQMNHDIETENGQQEIDKVCEILEEKDYKIENIKN